MSITHKRKGKTFRISENNIANIAKYQEKINGQRTALEGRITKDDIAENIFTEFFKKEGKCGG